MRSQVAQEASAELEQVERQLGRLKEALLQKDELLMQQMEETMELREAHNEASLLKRELAKQKQLTASALIAKAALMERLESKAKRTKGGRSGGKAAARGARSAAAERSAAIDAGDTSALGPSRADQLAARLAAETDRCGDLETMLAMTREQLRSQLQQRESLTRALEEDHLIELSALRHENDALHSQQGRWHGAAAKVVGNVEARGGRAAVVRSHISRAELSLAAEAKAVAVALAQPVFELEIEASCRWLDSGDAAPAPASDGAFAAEEDRLAWDSPSLLAKPASSKPRDRSRRRAATRGVRRPDCEKLEAHSGYTEEECEMIVGAEVANLESELPEVQASACKKLAALTRDLKSYLTTVVVRAVDHAFALGRVLDLCCCVDCAVQDAACDLMVALVWDNNNIPDNATIYEMCLMHGAIFGALAGLLCAPADSPRCRWAACVVLCLCRDGRCRAQLSKARGMSNALQLGITTHTERGELDASGVLHRVANIILATLSTTFLDVETQPDCESLTWQQEREQHLSLKLNRATELLRTAFG